MELPRDDISHLNTALTDLITHTEQIFLSLGESFPKLIREMETGIRNSDAMISGFRTDEAAPGAAKRRDNPIAAAIESTRNTVEEAAETFNTMHRRDDALLETLDQNMRKLSVLDSAIAAIREDSIEIEICSLNAMTMAMKAGHSGKAFSYITDELKRLSVRTISLTEDISRTGERLRSLFGDYRSEVDGIRKSQEALFSEIRNRLYESFERVSRGMTELVAALQSIGTRSASVGRPLMGIMEGVQIQDIIRQSVQHVMIALEEYRNTDPHTLEQEERLDEEYFLAELADLCLILMEDIENRLRESIEIFHRHMTEVRSIIREVENERHGITGSSDVFSLFEDSSALLRNLLTDIRNAMRRKKGVLETGDSLMREVETIEECFRLFSTLLSRFRNVDVAARIEVAKQEVLQRMKSTVDSMTVLIARIGVDVETSLKGTKEFIQSTSAVVRDYTAVFDDEENTVGAFEENIGRNYAALSGAKERLSGRIASFSLYTGGFLELLDAGFRKLDELGTLLEDTERIKESLKALRSQAGRMLDEELEKQHRSAWELKDRKLKEIIEGFTIFTHKKAAGRIGGFEVEDGTRSGDVTLFT